MEVIRKYPKAIQWIFLLIIFFGLCFAIQIPEGYEFAKAGTEFIDKDKLDQTKYSVFWRLPAFIAWMPGWISGNNRNSFTSLFSSTIVGIMKPSTATLEPD